ncbi:GAP family protein [Paractinoplanes atraurantiacus]|uniref:Sap, sulfolipid-1-addressing protein n=1 Tax=Paractinoplanes atraurantiacus TaxID=1036182 RepID=A0A285I8P8_9ACTN|nr:GAP family protein [Actinoplanes atraurantiacus]SNY44187.1 Sap, sulfolipid-1-addressing protein [Actinoplanes atraurantiacus]
MDLALAGSLAVLALIDSTSFGTLLIPIWLLMHPGPVRAGRILVFLGTVAVFYFAVGLAVALGADAFLPQISRLLDTRPVSWIQLILGVGLFFWSFRLDRRRGAGATGGRLARWRERAMTDGGAAGLAGLALAAAAAEVTTMLPYLAAIGLLTGAGLGAGAIAVVMAAYCLIMILPALVLLGARLAAGDRLTPLLTRAGDRLARSNALAWIVGIVGFLLARDAALRLFDWIGA